MKTIQMNPSLNQKLSDPVPRFFHSKPDGLLKWNLKSCLSLYYSDSILLLIQNPWNKVEKTFLVLKKDLVLKMKNYQTNAKNVEQGNIEAVQAIINSEVDLNLKNNENETIFQIATSLKDVYENISQIVLNHIFI